MIHNPLLPAKLKFFEMVFSKLNAFLRGFQNNKPIIPFIADTLGDLVRDFFEIIISKDVLKKKSNLYNLIQINPLDKNIRKNPESVDNGFVAKRKLEQVKSSLNSANILEFKKQAGDFLAQLLHHLLEDSPFKYAVVRSAVCLNPVYLSNLTKKSSCESQMGILLQEFLSLGRISTRYAELVKKQYQKFFTVIDENQTLFSSFNPTNDRVDTLFQKRCDRQMNMEIFGNSPKFF